MYSSSNMLFVWRYMKKLVDIDASSDLGKYFCKSRFYCISVCYLQRYAAIMASLLDPNRVTMASLLNQSIKAPFRLATMAPSCSHHTSLF